MKRLKLVDVNDWLTCLLCGGYFIDATTITECLHSFCRTCLQKHLEGSRYCPRCDVQIHRTRPCNSIQPDRTLQQLVYKLVPGLFHKEMRRRSVFYLERPDEDTEVSGERRGEPTPDRIIFTPDEPISLSLQYAKSSDLERINKNMEDEANEKRTGYCRYLRCPAAVTIHHLKMFLRQKFNVSADNYLDVFYKGENLSDHLSLMDVAYIHKWTAETPMQFFYRMSLEFKEIQKLRVPLKQGVKAEPPKSKTDSSKVKTEMGKAKSESKRTESTRTKLESPKMKSVEKQIKEEKDSLAFHEVFDEDGPSSDHSPPTKKLKLKDGQSISADKKHEKVSHEKVYIKKEGHDKKVKSEVKSEGKHSGEKVKRKKSGDGHHRPDKKKCLSPTISIQHIHTKSGNPALKSVQDSCTQYSPCPSMDVDREVCGKDTSDNCDKEVKKLKTPLCVVKPPTTVKISLGGLNCGEKKERKEEKSKEKKKSSDKKGHSHGSSHSKEKSAHKSSSHHKALHVSIPTESKKKSEDTFQPLDLSQLSSRPKPASSPSSTESGTLSPSRKDDQLASSGLRQIRKSGTIHSIAESLAIKQSGSGKNAVTVTSATQFSPSSTTETEKVVSVRNSQAAPTLKISKISTTPEIKKSVSTQAGAHANSKTSKQNKPDDSNNKSTGPEAAKSSVNILPGRSINRQLSASPSPSTYQKADFPVSRPMSTPPSSSVSLSNKPYQYHPHLSNLVTLSSTATQLLANENRMNNRMNNFPTTTASSTKSTIRGLNSNANGEKRLSPLLIPNRSAKMTMPNASSRCLDKPKSSSANKIPSNNTPLNGLHRSLHNNSKVSSGKPDKRNGVSPPPTTAPYDPRQQTYIDMYQSGVRPSYSPVTTPMSLPDMSLKKQSAQTPPPLKTPSSPYAVSPNYGATKMSANNIPVTKSSFLNKTLNHSYSRQNPSVRQIPNPALLSHRGTNGINAQLTSGSGSALSDIEKLANSIPKSSLTC